MTHVSGSLSLLRERYGERYRWLLLLSVMVGTRHPSCPPPSSTWRFPDMSHYFTLGQGGRSGSHRGSWWPLRYPCSPPVAAVTLWLPRHLCWGHAALLAGGVGGGLARDFGLVLAARVAEGLAGALLQPSPAVIILYAFQPHEQGAPAAFLAWVVLAPALGPGIGGCWWTGLAGARFFHGGAAVPGISGWPISLCPVSALAAWKTNRQGEALDWRGLLLGTVGTLCLLNGLGVIARWLHGRNRDSARHRRGLCGCVHRLAKPTIQRGRKP